MVIEGEAREKIYQILADALDVARLYEGAIELNTTLQDMNDDLTISNRETVDENDRLKEEIGRLAKASEEHRKEISDAAQREFDLTRQIARLESENLELGHSIADDAIWHRAFNLACKVIQSYMRCSRRQNSVPWPILSYLASKLKEEGLHVEIPGEIIEFADDDESPMESSESEPPEETNSALLWWQDLADKARALAAERKQELERYKAASLATWSVLRDLENEAQLFTIATAFKNLMLKEGYDIETEEHRIEGFGSSGCEDNSEGKIEHDFL